MVAVVQHEIMAKFGKEKKNILQKTRISKTKRLGVLAGHHPVEKVALGFCGPAI